MAKIAVLTSGGDAPGMNTALASATKVASAAGFEMVGVRDGFDGLLDGAFEPLTPARVDDWWHRGGTMLGTARCPRFLDPAHRRAAARALEGFQALVVIGGNGSLTGAHLLAQETGTRVVGVPASIDHDIACTGHAIGVDTALNTITEATDRIADTARSHRRVFLVEVMGRDCGYLAMAAAIATGADAVLYREQGKAEDRLVDEVAGLARRAFSVERGKRHVLVIKAEGVLVPAERLGARVSEAIADVPGVSVRVTVLGHVVRGGNPSFRDRMIAGRLAHAATWAAIQGHGDVMVGWKPDEAFGYESVDARIRLFPLATVLAETARLLDGSHPSTRKRVRMLEKVQGIWAL